MRGKNEGSAEGNVHLPTQQLSVDGHDDASEGDEGDDHGEGLDGLICWGLGDTRAGASEQVSCRGLETRKGTNERERKKGSEGREASKLNSHRD